MFDIDNGLKILTDVVEYWQIFNNCLKAQPKVNLNCSLVWYEYDFTHRQELYLTSAVIIGQGKPTQS